MTARVVDDGGQGGVPVVFLHSLAGRASHWSSQLARLRTNRRALALELPGHGSAPPASDGDYSIEAMSRAVSSALGPLQLGRVVIAGHSFGGGVALEYARTHPDHVVGLLLLDPISDGRQIPASEVEPFLAALNGREIKARRQMRQNSESPFAALHIEFLEHNQLQQMTDGGRDQVVVRSRKNMTMIKRR